MPGTVLAFAAGMHQIHKIVSFWACAIASFLTLYAKPAFPCGGLFCSSVSPTPVDQNAERILFEVAEDRTITATVEIKYSGDPRAFSWIIPVHGTPDFIEVASRDELALLDAATRPSILPPTTVCSNPPLSGFACGPLASTVEDASRSVGTEGEGEGGGVIVTDYPNVGPFGDIIVVEGRDPDELITFLNTNGYLVSPAMRPFIERYSIEGQKFIAIRLQADADVSDIVPIRFHCPNPNPVIPLRLTAIAAEPDMGILVFIAGAQRFAPSNYVEVSLGDDVRSLNGATNYFALVSKKIDDAGGLGFVVERAEQTRVTRSSVDNLFLGLPDEVNARAALGELFERRPYITRLYTRMSGEEMLEDPFFIETNLGDYNGVHDLSGQTIDVCPPDRAPQPLAGAPTCGTRYCGDGDGCAVSDIGVEGCVCREGRSARLITSPTGEQQTICMTREIDVHPETPGGDACNGYSCGEGGVCVPINGWPTCLCDEESVAIVDLGRVRCAPRVSEIFEEEQVLWPEPPPVDDSAAGGCGSMRGDRAGGLLSLVLLLGVSALLRLRRKKR